MKMKLLTESNQKIRKGEKLGFFTVGLHLAPAKLAGLDINLCLWASNGCELSCLNTSGHGAFSTVQASRIRKTHFFWFARFQFLRQLIVEIEAAKRKAARKGLTLAVRLNLTSDVIWETIEDEFGKTIFDHFPGVQFYDYTKGRVRMENFLAGKFPRNYSLTFSRSESNEKDVEKISLKGGNVAVVFRGKLPENYKGKRVISGDESDARFTDPKGVVVGLVQKGKAKRDESGFVVSTL
jgi:hypothetical protein